MRFEEFQLERNQSLFENEVDYNLSESGVHPLKISEILSSEEQNQILDKELYDIQMELLNYDKEFLIFMIKI